MKGGDDLKLLSLFSGIGAFEKALKNLDVDYELLAYSEIDKYASKAYSLIHQEPESKNLGDITLIDEKTIPLPLDLITYGFPCQDISIAGGKQGLFNEDGSKTRSGLFFDALRIITHTQPKIAIAENVKNLTSKKFEKQFNIVLTSLEKSGYNNYFKVLNAKDYGIPQNRERVFIVSIRKDIDTGIFEFPKEFELKVRWKDLLEEFVDEKFYIKDYSSIECLDGSKITPNATIQCIGNVNPSGNGMKHIGNLTGGKWDKIHEIHKRVYSEDGIAPTIHTVAGGNTERKVMVGNEHDFQIRKSTPKECFRLMGFTDSDWQVLVDNKISNSQLYKMAGNSIVVDVAEEVLCQLLDDNNEIWV